LIGFDKSQAIELRLKAKWLLKALVGLLRQPIRFTINRLTLR
jgi:hypothetical protein